MPEPINIESTKRFLVEDICLSDTTLAQFLATRPLLIVTSGQGRNLNEPIPPRFRPPPNKAVKAELRRIDRLQEYLRSIIGLVPESYVSLFSMTNYQRQMRERFGKCRDSIPFLQWSQADELTPEQELKLQKFGELKEEYVRAIVPPDEFANLEPFTDDQLHEIADKAKFLVPGCVCTFDFEECVTAAARAYASGDTYAEPMFARRRLWWFMGVRYQ